MSRDVATRAKGLLQHVGRLEGAYRAGHVSLRDVEWMYGGSLLYFFAFAERSIERLFYGLLTGQLAASQRNVKPAITVRSRQVAVRIVTGGRPFVDWLPYKWTQERAADFFAGGRPFSNLTPSDKEAFHRLTVIRNALAHESKEALTKYEASCIDHRGIVPSQRRPNPYLRGLHSAQQTRLDYLMSDVVGIIRRLSA